jgi:gluconolactonase
MNRPSAFIGDELVTHLQDKDAMSRRTLVQALAAGAAAVVAGAGGAAAQTGAVAPPTTITNPPRDFDPRGAPTTYPDIIAVEPQFNAIAPADNAIERLFTGLLWGEGPAWSVRGRYLVWSDIPNNRQLRWWEGDGQVSVFRYPSNNSNGNTFDFQGRQLSCEHLTRRVVRYEHDGTVSVIADSYQGKRFNSPNDIVPHPDGSYWFTDPPYGIRSPRLRRMLSAARPTRPSDSVAWRRELPTNCYRVDPSGRVDLVLGEDQLPDPNGLVFSPDYKKLYVISTARGPGDTGPGGKNDMHVFDVGSDNKLSNQKLFSNFMIDGVNCGPDGARCDVNGNVWVSSNAGRAVGYNGVTAWTPAGQLVGRVRLPELCTNICFGGPKRNRLFITTSQSLYAVYVGTQGAAPG